MKVLINATSICIANRAWFIALLHQTRISLSGCLLSSEKMCLHSTTILLCKYRKLIVREKCHFAHLSSKVCVILWKDDDGRHDEYFRKYCEKIVFWRHTVWAPIFADAFYFLSQRIKPTMPWNFPHRLHFALQLKSGVADLLVRKICM